MGILLLVFFCVIGILRSNFLLQKNAPRANSKADIEKTGLTFRNMPLIISSCTNSSNPNSSHMNYFVWKYMKEGKDGEKEENWS